MCVRLSHRRRGLLAPPVWLTMTRHPGGANSGAEAAKTCFLRMIDDQRRKIREEVKVAGGPPQIHCFPQSVIPREWTGAEPRSHWASAGCLDHLTDSIFEGLSSQTVHAEAPAIWCVSNENLPAARRLRSPLNHQAAPLIPDKQVMISALFLPSGVGG